MLGDVYKRQLRLDRQGHDGEIHVAFGEQAKDVVGGFLHDLHPGPRAFPREAGEYAGEVGGLSLLQI